MLKSIFGVFVIALVPYFGNSEERDASVPSIHEDLPLILVKTNDDLALPDNVKIQEQKKWRRTEKKIQFTRFIYEKQAFYCPPETVEQSKKIEKANEIYNRKPNRLGDRIDKNCLFKKKQDKKTNSRFPQCQESPQPKIMPKLRIKRPTETEKNKKNRSDEFELATCGPADTGQSFIFGYQICDEYEGFRKFEYKFRNKNKIYPFRVRGIEMYQICYNAQRKEILYTSHIITAPSLFDHYLLEKEVIKKPSEEMRTDKLIHMEEIDFEHIKIDFEKIEKFSTLPKFKIQLLIPLDDFPFLIWKKPVNHYVNASLMHEKLQPCWNSIHDSIRNNAIETKRKFTIHTRVFKHDENPAAKEIHIPSIWVKFVRYLTIYGEEKGVAIIANNYRDISVWRIFSERYKCAKNLCWSVVKYEFAGIGKDIRCCEPNKEIQELFGLNIEFQNVLDIPGLIDENEEFSYYRSESSPPY